jgi:hypothetical protein
MSEWRAISARISGLLEAATFFTRTNDNDNYGTGDILINDAHITVTAIKRLFNRHSNELPVGPRACVESFLEVYEERFLGSDKHNPFARAIGFAGVTAVVTSLASFRAEFEYLISDTESITRSLVARAFIHLQRSIVADELIREKWQRAFAARETVCEGLGACHLLAHGIWAFKTSAEGERTDLVLSKPLEITDEIRRASQGLTLTEWKLVRHESELSKKVQEAYQQARRYCMGILAGFELSSPRYLVIVSEDFLVMPSPREEGGIRYEFRNIAVTPSTPSQAVRNSEYPP